MPPTPERATPRWDVVFIGAATRASTGGERYGREVIDKLSRAADVEVVTHDDLPRAARGYLASNVWLVRRYWRRLRHLTVVEDHFWHPRTFVFNGVARARGARVVVIVHHLYHRLRPRVWQRWVDRRLEWMSLAAAQRIIVNSEATADEIADLGIRRSRMTVIHPGVDNVPQPTVRAAGPELRLLAVGNVAPRKGLDVLVRALAGVSFPFTLEVVGDAAYDAAHRRALDELILASGLSRRVVFRGRIPSEQLEDAYRAADVFVAPSHWEGFGMALLDALLHGLPVVASRVGAIPELVVDGETGLLVPAGEVEALRAALERLAADQALRRRLGERAREKALGVARSWDAVAADAASVVMGTT